MKRIVISGSRSTNKREYIVEKLCPYTLGLTAASAVRFLHGACPTGADHIAQTYLAGLGLEALIEQHPADWATYGRWAGPKRNKEMIARGPDQVIAFPSTDPDAKGTRGLITLAIDAGIPIEVWPV